MKEKLPPRPLIVLLLLLGSVALFVAGRGAVQTLAARDWPDTEGSILSAGVQRSRPTPGRPAARRTYRHLVLYRYAVEGKDYESRRVSFFHSSWGGGGPISRYRQGETVKVYYDPQDPERAILERELPSGFFVAIGAGVLFAGGGVLLLLLRVRRVRTGHSVRNAG